MEILYQALKMILVLLFSIGQLFSPEIAGGDFPPSEPVERGDETKYVQISADDEGFDTWQPVKDRGGYRYGPSMILNSDGSLDVWSASNGPGDMIDLVSYKRYSPDFKESTKEVIALKPTAESYDHMWTCDPGTVKFGDYYYIGYTTTANPGGIQNVVCVARSKNPEGPFNEKWTGSGWGTDVQPLFPYTDDQNCFGAGEPSFVVMGETLYVYYSWCNETGATTRVATADATDENWPATLQFHGECIPPKNGGDSADVKYFDEYGRFVAVFTEKRFSDESYVAVWESFDGITFRPSGFVKANTCKKLHNCGISGRADGHVAAGDPVYLSYAYAGADIDGISWGNWATRLHKVTLSLADEPDLDASAVTNSDVAVTHRDVCLVPEVVTIKAEKQSYTISKSEQIWVMAFDTDYYIFPILSGMSFDGYDTSVIRIVGTRMFPVAPGDTRVWVHWHGFSGDFVVHVTE
ncbi:MAG: hypothetical protein K6G90_12660 [Clostridia bacterium]|nr:hypothetical protein [Clostridia bacterium]